jgi:hypothetical protein
MRLLSALLLALSLAWLAPATLRAAPAGWDRAQALLAGNRADLAVPLLDALVSADPQDIRYRLALARALLATGQRDRARHHLAAARGAAALSADERRRLDDVLARLDGGKGWEGWLRLAVVPESNPGQQTSATTVDWGGWTLRLNPGARATPATGLHLGAGGALLPRIGPGLRLRLGAAVEARLFERSALNDVTARGEFGLQGQTAGGATWGLWLTAQDRRIGNRAFGWATGLVGFWAQRAGPRGQVQVRAETERWRHAVQVGRDGRRHALSLGYVHALRPDLTLRATAFGQWTDARAGWESGRTLGASLGVQKQFTGGLTVSLDVMHLRHARAAADPGFGVIRRDRRTSLTARVMHRTVSLNGFAPVLELGLDRQRSTLPLNTFRNARVSVGLTRQF